MAQSWEIALSTEMLFDLKAGLNVDFKADLIIDLKADWDCDRFEIYVQMRSFNQFSV